MVEYIGTVKLLDGKYWTAGVSVRVDASSWRVAVYRAVDQAMSSWPQRKLLWGVSVHLVRVV